MPSTTDLSKEFLEAFNITEILERKPRSGQKQVLIVKKDGIITALKIISTVDERIKRELKIYDEFRDVDGIPCIIGVQEFGHELVVSEEFIEGNDLYLIEGEYFSKSDKIRKLILSVSQIMKPVWEKNYVHRDLKPQNIIIRKDGSPVVIDFGIARDLNDGTITPSGFQPNSWRFASPEQFFGNKEFISYRTDFFCLGIIAYNLFTGKNPFGDSIEEIAECFNNDQLQFDVGDAPLNLFLNTVLRFRVADRPRNYDIFIKSLSL